MEKKMTKRDYFETLYNMIQEMDKCGEIPSNEMLAFLEHEIELLSRKKSVSKKVSAQQALDETLRQAILDGLEYGHLYTITEIMKEIPECADLSNQKVTSLIKPMIDNTIEKVVEKRKSYYRKLQ